MASRERRQFGLWDSPIQAHHLTGAVRFRDVAWDSDGHTLVWLEGRGADNVIVGQTQSDEAPRDLTTGIPVRAQVGYGGGEFAVSRGQLYFVAASGRIYTQALVGGKPRPITPAFGKPASPTVSPNSRWLAYVHHGDGDDRLAIVDTEGTYWPQSLASGADFYMQPAWHPRGHDLAWIEWDHPQMPWDGSRLVLGKLRLSAHGLPSLRESTVLAGDVDTSVSQPTFSPDGRLLAYLSDQRGWSNLWIHYLESGQGRCLMEDNFDIATPAWVQGMRFYSFSSDSRQIYFARTQEGSRRLHCCTVESGEVTPVAELSAFTAVEQIAACSRGNGLACIGSSSRRSARVLSRRRGRILTHARSTGEMVDPEALSGPGAVTWKAEDGTVIHGLYYPPANPAFDGPGRPPLIVDVHGGPTGNAGAGYDAEIQYFATRGYAILSVDYRGSTGYGRRYMESLKGNWGVFDVEDAIGGARHLVDAGLVDPDRLVIMGGSAGGYTVLRALAAEPGFFKAGVCSYGISNLFSLAAETHKFEARYMDSLLGPLPEAAATYRERSPLFAADRLRDPIAIFQGTDDEVVPRDQSDAIVESLRQRHVPHVYHVFEGEGHGWRKPETVEAYVQAVESFLKEHVLFA